MPHTHHAHDVPHDHETPPTEVKHITLWGALSNIVLGLVKIIGGLIGHSHALIADGAHSLADLLIDFLVLFSAHYAYEKADPEHPYGHARIETVSTAALALILIGTGFGIIYDAGEVFLRTKIFPRPDIFVLAIALGALVIKELLYRITLRYAERYQSPILRANAWHHRSDAATSLVVVVGIIGALMGYVHTDAIAAIIVALLIIKMGWTLTSSSVKELVDSGLEPQQLDLIRRATFSIPGVQAIHQLRSRKMAGRILLDMHIMVSPQLSVSEGHYIAAKVHRKLIKIMPNIIDVTIHVDPEDDETAPTPLNLLPRPRLIKELKKRWHHYLNEKTIEQVTLHYLSGKITLEVKISYDEIGRFQDAKTLATQLKQSLEDMPKIGGVKLLIEVS